MSCVFPILSIKALSIMQSVGKSDTVNRDLDTASGAVAGRTQSLHVHSTRSHGRLTGMGSDSTHRDERGDWSLAAMRIERDCLNSSVDMA
ncbi:MAG: hypothetical protein OXG05_06105 [Gammaproteobacteria bacterium]|nr:hypothetical protein [Gammaproteobacteria bacterium]